MNILFVCTANVFRSMSAEYILKDYLKKHSFKGINASSAGITADSEDLNPLIVGCLKGYGIDVSKHIQRKVTQRMVDEADLVIAMGLHHKEYLKEDFNIDAPYYNMIAIGKDTPVLDVDQTGKPRSAKHDKAHFESTIKYLYDTMPKFYKNMKNFMK